ncbi:hypothetical protein E3N88_24656 [Mikania micrantha]|uniref:Reverse transcriptase Ty1/copia-type domain-containing protein n=1 Tax=Mikania micrantha TaxID=192012 RepID=A0A5N6N5F2_9ASTR|nr:hypothetical protein E3N88_24656 [Mikania micrantha]
MWNAKIASVLLELGFEQSKCDYSLFIKNSDSCFIVVLVYVDDIVITGTSFDEISKVKDFLRTKFLIKDLGILKYFLGIEVIAYDNGLCLSQRKYCLDLLAEYGMTGCKPVNNPMEANHVITGLCNKHDSVLTNITGYQKLVGKLIHLSHTRPDISYSVHFLSQYMHCPKDSHLRVAMRLLRYLKKSHSKGILFSKGSSFELKSYADSDWAKCTESRKSVTGFCVFLGSSLVSWKSKKQPTISRSTAEAEYRSMCAATCDVIGLINVLQELGVIINLPVSLFCDSSATISIAANPVFHERTKHFELDLFFLREKISSGCIKAEKINSKNQVADIFTKGLLVHQHEYLCNLLGMFDIFSY